MAEWLDDMLENITGTRPEDHVVRYGYFVVDHVLRDSTGRIVQTAESIDELQRERRRLKLAGATIEARFIQK